MRSWPLHSDSSDAALLNETSVTARCANERPHQPLAQRRPNLVGPNGARRLRLRANDAGTLNYAATLNPEVSLPLAQSMHAAQFNGLAHACFLRRSLCAHAWPRSLTSLRAQGFLVAAAASANSAINDDLRAMFCEC